MGTGRKITGNQPQWFGGFDLRAYRHPKAYVRVSTDEQAEEGTSIDVQTRQLRAFAANHGVELNDHDIYVDDGWSGKSLDRPALRQLCEDVRAGLVDCVLVTKLDRFSRNLRDTVNLCLGEWQDEAPADRQVVLKSIGEPFDTHTDFGRMVFGLLAMFAEFERRRISERTWSGKVSRAEAGRNAGHRPPYGFRLAAAPDGRASYFEVVPAEAALIRRIAELYLHGFGYDLIARRLNEEGSRFRCGRLWQSQHIARILSNPLIAGVYAYGRVRRGAPGSSAAVLPSPIIPPAQFQAIQRRRAARSTGGRAAASSYLLTGLLRCGRCGAPCGVKRSGSARYSYYRCLRRKESGTLACTQPNIRVDRLDDLVRTGIQAVLEASREAVLQRLRLSVDGHRAGLVQALAELENEEQRLHVSRQRYFQWLETGAMKPESVQARLDALDERLAGIASEKAPLVAKLAALTRSEALTLDSGWFESAWQGLTAAERKRLVATLISGLEVNGDRVKITWTYDLHQVEWAFS